MHSSYIFDVLLCMYTTQAAQEFGLLVKNADVRASFGDNFAHMETCHTAECKYRFGDLHLCQRFQKQWYMTH